MSYLDTPSASGEGLIGALLTAGGSAAAATATLVIVWVLTDPGIGFALPMALPALLFVFFYTFVLGLFALVFFGLPTTLLLRRLNVENAGTYSAAGAIAGAMVGYVTAGAAFPTFVIGVPAGAVGGFLWWRCYRQEFYLHGDTHA